MFAQSAATAGDLICEKPIVYFTEENTDLQFPPNAAITFKTEADLDKFVEYAIAKGFSKDTSLALIADFVGGTNTDECFICNSSHVINHSATPNAIHELKNGAYCITACANIEAGDELFCDYNKYEMPDFYLKEFCVKNGITDLKTCALAAVAAVEAAKAEAEAKGE